MFQVLFQLFNKKTLRNPPAFLRVSALMIALLLYGTTGFLYFELPNNPDLTWWDALWYTIVTLTTVGYGDFFPKSPGGRFFCGWADYGFWDWPLGLCPLIDCFGARHLKDKGDQRNVSI